MHVAQVPEVWILAKSPTTRNLILMVLLGVSMATRGWAIEQNGVSDQAVPLRFDIPAQPLTSALEAYAIASGREVLYNAQLATGRVSTELTGVFTPEAALQILLGRTGLTVKYTSQDAFVVVAVPTENVDGRLPRSSEDPSLDGRLHSARYYGLVQQRIKDAFCENAAIRPGPYRIALRFWIDPSGAVQRSKLLGTTGQHDRDIAIDDTMRHLAIGEAPPAELLQPFTLLILPRRAEKTRDCASIDGHRKSGENAVAEPSGGSGVIESRDHR